MNDGNWRNGGGRKPCLIVYCCCGRDSGFVWSKTCNLFGGSVFLNDWIVLELPPVKVYLYGWWYGVGHCITRECNNISVKFSLVGEGCGQFL